MSNVKCQMLIFEHRDENKSCSACRERVNERLKVLKVVKVKECESETERVTFEHRHENKSFSACTEGVNERVQVCQVPSFCLTFRHLFIIIFILTEDFK